MSQSTAVRSARPAPRPGAPRLRAVAAPVGARSRAGLVMGCLSLLSVGLVGLLLLNMSLEKGAFVRRRQQAELERLLEAKQALTEELAALSAPQSLAVRAAQLGMVPAPNAAFVRMSDGRRFGVPSPAVAAQAPSVTIRQDPASGRGISAGPAASPSPTVGTTAGTAKAPTKVTVTTRVAATTTAVPGTPAGRRTGGAVSAPSQRIGATAGKASARAGTASDALARKVTREPAVTVARTP
jgi:hypothetical protein